MPKDDPVKAYAKHFHCNYSSRYEKPNQSNKLSWRDVPTKMVTSSEPPENPRQPPPVHVPYLKQIGYVYYAGDGNGRVKIGFSANPWSRCKEMRTFNPDLALLAVEKGTRELEHLRQIEFKEDHLALEWFKRSEKLDAWLNGLKPTS